MIFSATLSKPVKNIRELLGDDYMRVRIKYLPSSKNEGEDIYFAEFFTEKQVFHKKMSVEELSDFLSAHEGTSFRSCVERTEKNAWCTRKKKSFNFKPAKTLFRFSEIRQAVPALVSDLCDNAGNRNASRRSDGPSMAKC